MAIDTSVPRSRRALLAGGLGGAAALVASALGRPLPVSAADGQAVAVGGEYKASSVTKFDTGTTGATALWGKSGTGTGIWGESTSNTGVSGGSTSGKGVVGTSDSGAGVFGWSNSFTAVWGLTESATGVTGYSTSGTGVSGRSASGTGLYAATDDPKKGYALRAVGRVKLDQCAGVTTIATGAKSKVVTPGIDLTSTSAVVATLQGSAGGTTTVHRCVVNGATNTFTVYLTANSTTNAKVAWHVFG